MVEEYESKSIITFNSIQRIDFWTHTGDGYSFDGNMIQWNKSLEIIYRQIIPELNDKELKKSEEHYKICKKEMQIYEKQKSEFDNEYSYEDLRIIETKYPITLHNFDIYLKIMVKKYKEKLGDESGMEGI